MNSSLAAEFGSGQKSLLQRVSEDEAEDDDDDKTDGTLSIVLQRPIPRRWNANHPNSNQGYLTSAFRPLHSLDVSMSTTTESSEMMHLQQRPPAPVPPGSSASSSSSSTSEMSAADKKQHLNPFNLNKRAGVVFADRTNNNNVTVKSTTTSLFVKPPKPEKTPYKQQPQTQTQVTSRKSGVDPTPQKVLNVNANSSFVVSDQGDGLIPTRRLAQEPEGIDSQGKDESSSIVLGAALYSDDDDDSLLLQHNAASAHPTPAKQRTTTFLASPSSTTRGGGFNQNDSAIRSTVAEQGSLHPAVQVLPATPATQQGWNLNDDSAILSTVAEQGSVLHPQTTPTPGPSFKGNVLFHDTPGGMDTTAILSTVAEQGSVSAPHLLQTPAATKSKNIFHLMDQQPQDPTNNDEQPQQDVSSTTPFSPREQQFMVRSPQDAKQLLRTAVAALQEARHERDAAREWAHHMKASVEQWATEQRKLIEVEQRTAAAASQNNNNNHESSDDTHDVIQKLELAIRSLQDQVQATAYDRRKTERDLQQMLQDQQGKLDSLGHQMAVMEQTLSEASHASGSPRAVGGNLPPAYIDKLTASAAKKCSPKSTLTTTPKASSGNASTTSSRIRKRLQDGGHVVVYGNGVRKEVHRDGTTIVRFPETGDIETKFTSGTVAYYHARENVMQVTTLDGAVLYEYPNRQVERHYPDGSKAILYPDGTKQKIASNGKVEASVVPLFHNDGE